MTYSETREMYTFFYAEKAQKREERFLKMSNAARLFITWFIPWAVTSLSVVSVYSLLNAKGLLVSFIIMAPGYLFSRYAGKKDKAYRSFSVVFSYLIALSAVLTVIL